MTNLSPTRLAEINERVSEIEETGARRLINDVIFFDELKALLDLLQRRGEALESAINCVQKYHDTYGDIGDYATLANLRDWLDILNGRDPHGETNAPDRCARTAIGDER